MPRPQALPSWTLELLAGSGIDPALSPWHDVEPGFRMRDTASPGYRLISYRVADALSLDEATFQADCAAIYHHLAQTLTSDAAGGARHPIRLWNFIPHILAPLGAQEHRYIVFNAGRFEALSAWLGGPESLDRRVATASGVGHAGTDLEIHCLAAEVSGEPIENPRQISSYRYSERYGAKPPCFARATRFRPPAQDPWLLVGGTASVLGEDSAHFDDLDLQLQETLCNLAAVAYAGGARPQRVNGDPVAALLDRYRHLRIYYVRPEDKPVIDEFLRRRLHGETELEWVPADLCRPELLVEIEGIVDLSIQAVPDRQLDAILADLVLS